MDGVDDPEGVCLDVVQEVHIFGVVSEDLGGFLQTDETGVFLRIMVLFLGRMGVAAIFVGW